MFDADNRRKPFACIIAAKIGVRIFQQVVLARIIVDRSRDCCPEPCEMGTAVDCVDRICERIHGLSISICILKCDFDSGPFCFFLDVNHRVQYAPIVIKIRDKGADPAFEEECHLPAVALVEQMNVNAPGDKRHISKALN